MSLHQPMYFQIKGIRYREILIRIKYYKLILTFFCSSCISTFVSAVNEENTLF